MTKSIHLYQLEISDEEILREVFHRLIEKVDIFEDGSIEIYYSFINPAGA